MLVKSYMLHQLTRTLVSLDAAHFPWASLSQNGGGEQLFLLPNSHHTSNSSSCVQSTYWTNHCFLSETQTRSVVQKILEQMLVRLFGQGVAAPLWEICGPEETIRGDSVDPPFCFQWCSLPGKTLSRDLPLCLYMTTYSSCFQSTTHLLFVGTTFCEEDARQVLARLETKLTG